LERIDNPDPEMWSFPMVMDGVGAAGAIGKMERFSFGGNRTIIYFNLIPNILLNTK